MRRIGVAAGLCAAALAIPAPARDSIGLYAQWGAFRDAAVPRCYAIAKAVPSSLKRDYQPYASIGTWPRRALRNQVHFRASRKISPAATIVLTLGAQRFELVGGGGDAWPADRQKNAAIVAAMRSAPNMTLSTRDVSGRRFSNSWNLAGAASAMDAASLGCARLR
ncbi:MAG TPA: hypothetical protein VJM34_14035 [Novosphingobium sp.]|nr:hypothetical protein [Novosphingobium sp.]